VYVLAAYAVCEVRATFTLTRAPSAFWLGPLALHDRKTMNSLLISIYSYSVPRKKEIYLERRVVDAEGMEASQTYYVNILSV
jgi:hypothetical protein